MDNKAHQTLQRLKKVLLNDKTLPNGLISVLMADLNDVFKSYFDYHAENMSIDIDVGADGRYILRVETPIEHIKSIKEL